LLIASVVSSGLIALLLTPVDMVLFKTHAKTTGLPAHTSLIKVF
jgi:hypothetical protein